MSNNSTSLKTLATLTALTADHITYTDTKLIGETDNSRMWFIKDQYPMNDADYYNARHLSLYWYYMNTLGCEYNAVIHRRVGSLIN